MKSIPAVFSTFGIAAVAFVFCLGTAHGQYELGMDNPHLNKKSASPAPSAAAKGKTAGKGGSISEKDNKFLSDAAASFGWEVKTGSLAEQKAQDAKTKQVASRLVASYSKLAKEVTDLAGKKGRSISIEGVKAQNITGSDYDKRYLNLVQQDHQQTVSAFKKASQSADDPDVRAWAKRTLPTLQQNASAAK